MCRSCLEYAAIVWMSANDSYLQKLENLQQRAFRIMRLTDQDKIDFNLEPLAERRRSISLAALYRLHLKSCPKFLKDILPTKLIPHRRTRNSQKTPKHALDIKSFCDVSQIRRGHMLRDTDQFQRTFLSVATKEWNSLAEKDIGVINCQATLKQDIVSIKNFKTRISKQTVKKKTNKHEQ